MHKISQSSHAMYRHLSSCGVRMELETLKSNWEVVFGFCQTKCVCVLVGRLAFHIFQHSRSIFNHFAVSSQKDMFIPWSLGSPNNYRWCCQEGGIQVCFSFATQDLQRISTKYATS